MEDQKCKFCAIANDHSKGYVVYEDQYTLTFLDRRPLFPGHCLLIPKKHYQTFTELPDYLVRPLFINSRMLCKAVKEALSAEGSFMAINNNVSQSIPHLHIHIVPRTKGDGLKGFFWPRHPYEDEEHMQNTQKILQRTIEKNK